MSEEVKEEIEALMSIYEEDMQGEKYLIQIKPDGIDKMIKTCLLKIYNVDILHEKK